VVFAVAAGLKFWHTTTPFRKHLLGIASRTERFKQSLEGTWRKDQKALEWRWTKWE
jgi:hypothetical protein